MPQNTAFSPFKPRVILSLWLLVGRTVRRELEFLSEEPVL
jgi:hypothetical protein